MTTYNMTITGGQANITNMLEDLLETKQTAFNLAYKMELDSLNWSLNAGGKATVSAKATFDTELKRSDIRNVEDSYEVAIALGGEK